MKEYLQALPPERREPIEFLHAMIQKISPTLKPHFAINMLGFGSFPYKNYKKDLGKVSVGKSCIRFKKLSDLNLVTLKKVIKATEKNTGLVGAGR